MNITRITKRQLTHLTRYTNSLDIVMFEADYTLFLINEILYPPTNIESVINKQTTLSNSTILYCDNYKSIVILIIPHTIEDKIHLVLAFHQLFEEMSNDIFELSYNADKITMSSRISGNIIYSSTEITNIISEAYKDEYYQL